MTAPDDLASLIADFREGIECVPYGPWVVLYDDDTESPLEIVRADDWNIRVCFPTSNAPKVAEHLARCSPDNIRALLDRIAELEAARGAGQ